MHSRQLRHSGHHSGWYLRCHYIAKLVIDYHAHGLQFGKNLPIGMFDEATYLFPDLEVWGWSFIVSSIVFLLVYITYTLQWSLKTHKFPNRIYAMIREKDRIN